MRRKLEFLDSHFRGNDGISKSLGLSCSALIVLLALGGFQSAHAKPPKTKGEVGIETRAFQDDGNPLTEDVGVAAVARLNVTYKAKPFKLEFRGFARYDQRDQARSAMFAEEAWVEYKKNPFRLRVGYQVLNWTATEAFHPADVINSRYLDTNIENQEKLGEPMVSARVKIWEGTLTGYFMPVFVDPILPSGRSRQNYAPPGVALGDPIHLRRDGSINNSPFGTQWAARFQQNLRGADIGIHVLQQMDRYQPFVVFSPRTGRPRPLFQSVTQVGGTYSQVLGPLLAKLETSYRWFDRPDSPTRFGVIPDRNHGQVAVGFEYGFANDDGSESTFLLEGQTIYGQNKRDRANLWFFQRDALVGFRHAFNDAQSKELLVSAIVDVERSEEILFNASYTQRFWKSWKLTASARVVHAPPDPGAFPTNLQLLHRANQLSVSVVRYF